MKKLLLLLFPIFLLASDPMISDYLSFYEKYQKMLGPPGAHKKGEIEILLDPKKIKACIDERKNLYVKMGLTNEQAEEWSRIGVVYEDKYWILVRDPVLFPSKTMGTYNRLYLKPSLSNKYSGVAIMALVGKRIAVNVEYRHATRTFELELPRGTLKENETPVQGAKRELREETGLIVDEFTLLGEMAPDSGVLGSIVPIYAGKMLSRGQNQQEDSEAIFSNLTLSKDELKNAFLCGFIEMKIAGRNHKVLCRDSFLAFALLQAELHGLL